MRIGLLSDCEGDVAALEAALAAIRPHAPDVVVHAGDILCCPFSPDPTHQTIALLQAEGVRAVLGNHDRYLVDWGTTRWPHTLWMRLRRADPPPAWVNDVAAGQAQIPPADLDWLRALPEELVLVDGVYVCHGMPGNPWNSIWPRDAHYDGNVSDRDRDASLRMLADLDIDLALCGHTPRPLEYRDRLPDGRELRAVRAGSHGKGRVGYVVLTGQLGEWDVTWGVAEYTTRAR